MIYFVTDGVFIKIGTANSVAVRLAHMKSGNPLRLSLLATCEGGRQLENALHRIAGRKVSGSQEWFHARPPLLALIRRVQLRGIAAIQHRLAAKARLDAYNRARAAEFGERFERNAAGLIDDLCRKHGVPAISRITGQCEAAVRFQRKGTHQIGALALARLGTIEPQAINALICRAEKIAA